MPAALTARPFRRAWAAGLRALAERLAPCDGDSDAKLVADNSFDVIVRFDRNWKRTYVSPAVTSVLGFTPEQYKSRDWRDGVHRDQLHVLAGAVEQLEAGAPSATATYQRYRPDGRLVWLESTFRTLPDGGGYVAVLRDVTARKLMDEKVQYLAHHDALTGLANRPAFALALETQMRDFARSGEMFGLLALDLDRFKEVNDAQGHQSGDQVLKLVAERLRATLRQVDHVARLGGDEFAVLACRPVTPQAAALLAGRIVEALRRPFTVGGQAISIGVSIGLAMGGLDGDTAEELMKSADLALYRAKADGRSTFRFFETGMDESMQHRRKFEMELRQAVARDEFKLFYQPLLDIASNTIRGFEALVRWYHPDRGIILPDQFIPLAEETGLIVEIGERVLNIATQQAAAWGGDVTIAVNLSAVQFADGRLSEIVGDALARSGLPARRLELEITESVLLHDDAVTLACLHELRAMGVRIADG